MRRGRGREALRRGAAAACVLLVIIWGLSIRWEIELSGPRVELSIFRGRCWIGFWEAPYTAHWELRFGRPLEYWGADIDFPIPDRSVSVSLWISVCTSGFVAAV